MAGTAVAALDVPAAGLPGPVGRGGTARRRAGPGHRSGDVRRTPLAGRRPVPAAAVGTRQGRVRALGRGSAGAQAEDAGGVAAPADSARARGHAARRARHARARPWHHALLRSHPVRSTVDSRSTVTHVHGPLRRHDRRCGRPDCRGALPDAAHRHLPRSVLRPRGCRAAVHPRHVRLGHRGLVGRRTRQQPDEVGAAAERAQ